MTNEMLLWLFLLGALLGGVFGSLRGHNVLVSILVSAFLFPIGTLLVLLVPGKKRCPQCRERIERKAMVCRFCQYRFGQAPAVG
jgi:hypothetical protein